MPHHSLLVPRVLVVDDERQIHASLRLRLGSSYELVNHQDPREALLAIQNERFDLCLVDLHMPHLDGFTFIARAQELDADLGYVVLSAFDTDENLRRTIPLGVYDFIAKPLPEREGFEARLPEWVNRTRERRTERILAAHAGTIAGELDSARLEREVELVASESARDALRQTANLLTTIHAHLISATALLGPRARGDTTTAHIWRNLEEARKTAEAAMTVAEGFFDSAYGSRDTSPAAIDEGIRHALSIAIRMSRADEQNKALDFKPVAAPLPVRGMSGIDFLLLMVPVLGVALSSTAPNTTVGISGEHVARLDSVLKDPARRDYLWINRKHALTSRPAVLLTITAAAPAMSRAQIEGWLNGGYAPLLSISARGLVGGLRKCQGLLGLPLPPAADQLRLVLVLPV